KMIVISSAKALEALDGVGEIDQLARRAGEDFSHEERLRQEAFDLAGAGHGELVFFRQFVHAQDRDDVLKGLVALQDRLNLTGDGVVFFTDDLRVEHARRGGERVNSRVDTPCRDRARQNGRGVQVGERGGRRRVGQVVGKDVNRLNRGNRALGRRGDAFLHGTHVGCQRRLITHGGRNTAEKSRHFRTCLREAEDVVHEEQNVLALVTEVFSNRQTGKGNASAGTRGFVHLAVNESCLGAFAAAELVNARLDHFV